MKLVIQFLSLCLMGGVAFAQSAMPANKATPSRTEQGSTMSPFDGQNCQPSGLVDLANQMKQIVGSLSVPSVGNTFGKAGFAYLIGCGSIGKDLDEAKYWLELGAFSEDASSIHNLAWMYHNGLGIPVDIPRAKELYQSLIDSSAYAPSVKRLARANIALLEPPVGLSTDPLVIPIDKAVRDPEQQQMSGLVSRGRIGVQIEQVSNEVAKSIGLTQARGALVRGVEPNSPAAKAGLEPGDIVLSFDGKPIESSGDLPPLVANTKPGTKSHIIIFRRGAGRKLDITVAESLIEMPLAQAQTQANSAAAPALHSPTLVGEAKAPLQSATAAPRSTLSLTASASPPDSTGVVTLTISTNSDTASLKINGDEAGGRTDGRYSVKRFAQIGSNSFEVIATDRFGNSSKQTVVVNREINVVAEKTRSLDPTLITAVKPRDAVAIIIGIEKYRRVPDADFANRDASAFYDYARRALGIREENIRLLVDDKADAAEILRSFKTWLPTRVNKNTTDVYVFYSGHGLPSEDGGSLYFLPHEVDRDLLERTAITQKEVVQAIQRTTPKSVTMFIDSCYSGQSRTGTTLLASARPISIAPKASTDFPSNFMVISASAPDQISSSSPELKHGIFSYYLMLGMEGEADVNKDGQITVGEMQTYLSQQVTRRASGMNRTQSPQTSGDLNRILVSSQNKAR